MGVESLSRWFGELVIHKYHHATQEELTEYGYIDTDQLRELHEAIGCLVSRPGKVEFWRTRVEQERKDGTPEGISSTTKALAKSIRGR